ncbi:helix-turn-helix transcriptional regulator [Stenotrophomonas sp. Ps181]|uniref:S24 family peptidase n=1 Tax=Stenotrophomonas sp. Ps181 TaxID=2859892 RepID=UPI0021E11256|nr:helix-turn-helix transcriptional regulator [Stenotrophomonas sp. Ps181]MCV0218804.1 helix-turn-helix transcriptional regulator [Stenotrophomonas sp. Ps181]
MTTALATRLKRARSECGITEPADAARRAGITPSALYQLEDGKTKSLSGETAVKLARVYRPFRVEWLITGELPERWDESHGTLISTGETPAGYVRFRVMEGEASGGFGAVNQDFPDVVRELDIAEWQVRQQLGFIPEADRVRLVTVRGDSMYPDIKNGDVVFVDVAKDYFDGDGLYLINLHGLTYVKRLQLLRDGLHVISTNRKYLSEVVPPQEADQLHVGGKILGLALLRSAQEV